MRGIFKKIRGLFSIVKGKIDKNGTDRLMTNTEGEKLSGIQAGAQVNPGEATISASGLMSAADKTRLNGIQSQSFTSGFGYIHVMQLAIGFVGRLLITANAISTDISLYWDVYVFNKVKGDGGYLGPNLHAFAYRNVSPSALYYEVDVDRNINIFFMRNQGSGQTYGGSYKVEVLEGSWSPGSGVVPTSATAIPYVSPW
jgi:hypothetical protein